MNKTFSSAMLLAGFCAALGTAVPIEAQQTPYGYGYGPHMWQLTPEQRQQMWENMQRWGMGPGMMGGYGPGYGMGPGMTGGPGFGMGPGIFASLGALNLSESQLEQVDKIHDKLREKQRRLMSQMWQEQARLDELYDADRRDPAAIGKAHERISRLQREALEARIEAENKVMDLLTKEQKDKLRRGRGWGMMGY